ncbi:hypothetical protein BJ165DRAFT_1523972 [Panaeolus papilionaceus]|nr:hypothetical protein BJ165DRAFT_1523972 [Panaeolus papilionaceus]
MHWKMLQAVPALSCSQAKEIWAQSTALIKDLLADASISNQTATTTWAGNTTIIPHLNAPSSSSGSLQRAQKAAATENDCNNYLRQNSSIYHETLHAFNAASCENDMYAPATKLFQLILNHFGLGKERTVIDIHGHHLQHIEVQDDTLPIRAAMFLTEAVVKPRRLQAVSMVNHWSNANPIQGSAFHELVVLPTFAPELAHPYHVPGTTEHAAAKAEHTPSAAADNMSDSAVDESIVEDPADNQEFYVLVTVEWTEHIKTACNSCPKCMNELKNTPAVVKILSMTCSAFVTAALGAHGLQGAYVPRPQSGPGMQVSWTGFVFTNACPSFASGVPNEAVRAIADLLESFNINRDGGSALTLVESQPPPSLPLVPPPSAPVSPPPPVPEPQPARRTLRLQTKQTQLPPPPPTPKSSLLSPPPPRPPTLPLPPLSTKQCAAQSACSPTIIHSVLNTLKDAQMANLFNFSLPFTSAQPLPPNVSQPATALHIPTNFSNQFKVTSPETTVLISVIKTLEAQVHALAAQNLSLQASNLMNQQWMKRSWIALEHKEKQAERKKNKEGNEVLRLPRGDAILVTRDEFFEAKVQQEKEKKARLQEKEDNAAMTKLWEEQKLKWDEEDAERQKMVDKIVEKHARQVVKWQEAKDAARSKGVKMTKKAYIKSLNVFGEEEEVEEVEEEGSEGSASKCTSSASSASEGESD